MDSVRHSDKTGLPTVFMVWGIGRTHNWRVCNVSKMSLVVLFGVYFLK